MIKIRKERPAGIPARRVINEKAFGQPQEANVVDKLRQAYGGLLSLVAVVDGRTVGHILFSPAMIESKGRTVHGMGLAPMAVLPECQRQGIGLKLIRAGLDMLRSSSCPFVIVLGHPEYYPRFGFELASKYGVASQYDGIPDEAFMILIFDARAMSGVSGVARYRDEFDEAM